MIKSSVAIISGNRLTLHCIRDHDPDTDNTLIRLHEDDWVRVESDDTVVPVSKEDMMKVLSNIRIIHVRASTMTGMKELSVSSASMTVVSDEISTDEDDDDVVMVEQCQCPDQYDGSSCESCSPGYYRHFTNFTCLQCPCHQHEVSNTSFSLVDQQKYSLLIG